MSAHTSDSTPDDDPEYMTREEELDAEHGRPREDHRRSRDGSEKIADIAGDYGDGAPDDHYLAHIMLRLEAIAKDALDEARGTHRKALEAMQKRQQP